MSSELSLNFSDPQSKPYFLWSEDMSVAELREMLTGSHGRDLQLQYTARIMRECRIPEVWQFLTPLQIVEQFESLSARLGKSRRLWTYLIDTWQKQGLV